MGFKWSLNDRQSVQVVLLTRVPDRTPHLYHQVAVKRCSLTCAGTQVRELLKTTEEEAASSEWFFGWETCFVRGLSCYFLPLVYSSFCSNNVFMSGSQRVHQRQAGCCGGGNLLRVWKAHHPASGRGQAVQCLLETAVEAAQIKYGHQVFNPMRANFF